MTTRHAPLLRGIALLGLVALAAGASAAVPDPDALPDSSTSAATALPTSSSTGTGSGEPLDPASRRAQAQALHEQAKTLYTEGRYHEALRMLRTAVELDPSDKDLHYILAFVAEKLLELELALEHYRASAALEPDANEKGRLENIVRRVEGAQRSLAAARPAATAVPAARPPSAPAPVEGELAGWTLGLAAVGGASLLAGGIAGIYALATDPNPHASQAKDVERAHLAAGVSGAALTVGGVCGAVAAILAILDEPSSPVAAAARRAEPPRRVELGPGGFRARF